MMRVAAAVIAVLVSAGAIGAYHLFDLDVEPLGIEIVSETELQLVVSCAHDVKAVLSETVDAVHIDDVGGDPVDGDCLGLTTLRLANPLGERSVIVEGEEWVRHGPRCPFGDLAPVGCP